MADLLTSEEARIALGIGLNDYDRADVLAWMITGTTSLLEARVGPIVYGTISGELHDGGRSHIYLDQRPVAQITQIVEYDNTTAGTLTAETNSTKPAAGYLFDETSGKIWRRNQNTDARFPAGRRNVSVTYVAGRCAGTAIPDRYKDAAILTLKNLWRTFEPHMSTFANGEFDIPQAQFPRFAVPNAVKELLADEWQTGTGIG